MSDDRTSYDPDLPWLQEVEDEDGPRGVSARKMLAALLVVVLAAAIVAATFFWIGRRNAAGNGPPQIIAAPATPYKVKPQNPGGLDMSGESQTTFETSAGEDVQGRLDTSKLGESGTAETAPAPPAKTEPNATSQEPEAKPAPPPPPKPSGAPGTVVQLGAFRNTAQAERAWLALSARFGQLDGTTKMVVPYSAGGSSGYRLRAATASPADAKALCDALQAGGESCFIAR